MSKSDQFERACNGLEGYKGTIRVRYLSTRLDSPSIVASRSDDSMYIGSEIRDEELNVASWRKYGKLIKTYSKIERLEFGPCETTQEFDTVAALCLRAFFHELRENTSIEEFELDIRTSTAFPVVDLRYFFQNNQKLKKVHLDTFSRISPEQSAHISTALRDVTLNELIWNVNADFTNNSRVFEQILLACRRVKSLSLNNLRENFQIISVAGLLGDPMTLWENLYVSCSGNRISGLSVERAENEFLSGFHQNRRLKRLKVGIRDLFGGEEVGQRFNEILCNTNSLESVINSNHSLRDIQIAENSLFCQYRTPIHIKQHLEFNQNPNKMKVIRYKVMKYFSSKNFEISSLSNMPLAAVPQILAIDRSFRNKKKGDALCCSAIFNIIKSLPEVCAISSRGAVKTELQ